MTAATGISRTPAAWCLERNDRRIAFALGDALFVFTEKYPAGVAVHDHPAWKLMFPLDDATITVGDAKGVLIRHQGVLVPRTCPHWATSDRPHAALFVDAWMVPSGGATLLQPIEGAATDRLLRALDLNSSIEVEAVVPELSSCSGSGDQETGV